MEPIDNHDNNNNNNNNKLEDIPQVKEDNKSEIENKVARILKLLKYNGQDKKGKVPDDSDKKIEIIGLIQELQNEYNKLYIQYDHIKGEIGKKSRSKRSEKENSSIPSSDSEYYSSDEVENGDDSEPETPQELDFQTPREFQTPRGLKTPRKEHRSKRNDRNREHSTLFKVHEGSEASGQIKELEGQLTVVRMDLESVRKERDELQVLIGEKETEVKQLNETNLQLSSRVSELQMMVAEKGNEVSGLTTKMAEKEKEFSSRIEMLTNKDSAMVKALKDEARNMKDEIAKKADIGRVLLKEKEGFIVQIEELKLEVNSLHDQKNELEETIRGKEKESEKLYQENDILKAKVQESEKVSQENDIMKAKLQESENLDQENDILKEKIQESENLCQENDILKAKLQELESKSEQQENEASNRIIALKEQVNNLQQELDCAQSERRKWKTNSAQNLTELENEEQKKIHLSKTHSLDIQRLRVAESPRTSTRLFNQHTLERKIVELAEKFQMKVENQMRLLAQRIRVAEQIQTESKESYKKILEKLELENKELNGKNTAYESEAKKVKEMLSESGNSIISGLDQMVKKIDQEHGRFLNRMSRISDEIQSARKVMTGKNVEIKTLQENLAIFDESGESSAFQAMEKKIEDLEMKLREKDEFLVNVGEEKREVIRQLCVQIDYHRHRYDDLKDTVSKMPIRFKKVEK
ncbi:myosin heavy chain-related [Euphorbia peplus]|nr:myosin heavy chain-related [Euphorbia peplus]